MASETKTIVVAEDEALLRILAMEALEEAGFAVIGVEHADAALRHMAASAAGVHLIFTDIHMPGTMDGLALAHHVKGHWPHVALIIVSGEARPLPHMLPAGAVFIAKPYELSHITMHAQALTSAI